MSVYAVNKLCRDALHDLSAPRGIVGHVVDELRRLDAERPEAARDLSGQ